MQVGERTGHVAGGGSRDISDRGFMLGRTWVAGGVEVECLPGATAFVPALVVSGLPTDRFCFEGFLPPKKGRRTRLEALREERRTVILYESPHRLRKTLDQLSEVLGPERRLSVSREISKRFEETVRGRVDEIIPHFTVNDPRGEFVIVVAGADETSEDRHPSTVSST